jgi:hypothetical protein
MYFLMMAHICGLGRGEDLDLCPYAKERLEKIASTLNFGILNELSAILP